MNNHNTTCYMYIRITEGTNQGTTGIWSGMCCEIFDESMERVKISCKNSRLE